MTKIDLQQLKARHEGWLRGEFTSKGQREDSKVILELLAVVDALRAEADKRVKEWVAWTDYKADMQKVTEERDRLREALERVEKNTRMSPLLTDGTIQAVRDVLGMKDPRQSNAEQASESSDG